MTLSFLPYPSGEKQENFFSRQKFAKQRKVTGQKEMVVVLKDNRQITHTIMPPFAWELTKKCGDLLQEC